MSERQTCSKESPMPDNAGGLWCHPDAVSQGDEYNGLSGGGDYERFKCPHCGLFFRVELPD